VTVKRGKVTGAELRAFRHKVSILKKKGLVSKRTDARKQKPSRYMLEKVAKLGDVIEGKQVGVKLDRNTAQRYRQAGFFVFGNRVVVSRGQAETAKRDKGSGLIVISPLGLRNPFEKVVMPYSIKNIDQFLKECAKAPPDPQLFAAKKNPQDHWAFTFYGNNSLSTFQDIGLMGEYLERYISLQDDPRSFEYLILYRVIPEFWVRQTQANFENRKRASRQKFRADRKDERRKLQLRGREVMQARKETFEQQNARHQKEWRERNKAKRQSDASFAEAHRKAEAQRKANYRAKRKNRGK